MRPEFGEIDVADVRTLLETSGQASRFEFDAESRIRRRNHCQVIPMSPGASDTVEGASPRRSPSPDWRTRRRDLSPGSSVVSCSPTRGLSELKDEEMSETRKS